VRRRPATRSSRGPSSFFVRRGRRLTSRPAACRVCMGGRPASWPPAVGATSVRAVAPWRWTRGMRAVTACRLGRPRPLVTWCVVHHYSRGVGRQRLRFLDKLRVDAAKRMAAGRACGSLAKPRAWRCEGVSRRLPRARFGREGVNRRRTGERFRGDGVRRARASASGATVPAGGGRGEGMWRRRG